VKIIEWLMQNHTQLLVLFAGVIAGASVLIKGLEQMSAFLTGIFPKLAPVTAFLDKLAKSSLLNTLAMSPKQ